MSQLHPCWCSSPPQRGLHRRCTACRQASGTVGNADRGTVSSSRDGRHWGPATGVGWAAQAALVKTLARKHKTSVPKIWKKHRNGVEDNGQKYIVIEAKVERDGKKPLTARFGAASLARNPNPSTLNDQKKKSFGKSRKEIIDRLKTEECEMCGQAGRVESHHERKLKDINKPGRKEKPMWAKRMAAIRRKSSCAAWNVIKLSTVENT